SAGPARGTPTRDGAVAELPSLERPELSTGSCRGLPKANPRRRRSAAGLRRDPLCHLVIRADRAKVRMIWIVPVPPNELHRWIIAGPLCVTRTCIPRLKHWLRRHRFVGFSTGLDADDARGGPPRRWRRSFAALPAY